MTQYFVSVAKKYFSHSLGRKQSYGDATGIVCSWGISRPQIQATGLPFVAEGVEKIRSDRRAGCPFYLFDPGLIEGGVDFLGRLVTWPHDRLRAIRSPLVGSFRRAERLSVYECERCAVWRPMGRVVGDETGCAVQAESRS